MQFIPKNICEADKKKKKKSGIHTSIRRGTKKMIMDSKPLRYMNIEPRNVENKYKGIILSVYGKFMIQLV